MISLRSQGGQTLVQTLVSIGISAIVIAAMGAFVTHMQKSNRHLAQKLELLDLKNQLLSNFINPSVCTCQLNPMINTANAGNLKFDENNPAASMNLKEIRSGCSPTSFALVDEGQKLPGTQNSLVVESVRMTDIESTGNPDEFYGQLQISFTEGSRAGPLAPVTIRQKFSTDPASPSSAKTPLSCYSEQASLKVASGTGVGSNPSGSLTIDLELYGFDPLGSDPHIIVSERDANYDAVDGNTMDASYCGYSKVSKLRFNVICWASPDNSSGSVRSSFDWVALQK